MKILFVIVLYKCVIDKSKTYLSLLKDTNEYIYLYDNSPIASPPQNIKNLTYIHDASNGGLSIAYNKAAVFAKENHFNWMCILDQDTTFSHNAINYYKSAIEKYSQIKLFVPIHKISDGRYISPTKYFFKGSYPSKSIKTGILTLREAAPINSGMMINIEAFFTVGGYDDEVILDFSDIRFIEKFKKKYKQFYAIKEIVCLQDFSIEETNVTKLMNRYKIFLHCAAVCKRETILDYFAYFYITFKRTLHLIYLTRKISFLSVYLKKYILKK